MTNLTTLCITPNNSVRQAIAYIDRNEKGIVLVTNEQRQLLGTITDGDIRRGVLAGLSLDAPVTELLLRKATSLYSEPVTAALGTKKTEILRLMREHMVQQIPLLDDDDRVVDLVTMDELLPEPALPLRAVIMAGGLGTRLRPLTEDVPKPMLPVGSRPLLELIIEQLHRAGIRHLNITTHYKSEKITEHFGDGQNFGVDINYVSEDQPLGTAGALSLVAELDQPLLVINGDILTQVDFRAMLAFHREQKADLTVAVRQYDIDVPYGVLECDGPYIRHVREKPTYNFFVNAGLYLLEPDVLRYIPNNQRFDMTDLIEVLIAEERSVVSFPLVEYWLDIGQHADYQQAQEDLKGGRF